MTRLSLDELKGIMQSCAGADESVDLTPEAATMSFEELGYDSLAVIEMTTRLAQLFDIHIPDSETSTLDTPARLVDYVNGRLGTKG
ncbi:phosphopantetheine-binding protein [Phytohabitans sp. ZYX-F-186]|uniref:Phosphopantetheine-binding protein n=1 Tax=Phytohabitans maris TaxID=3071409 RepID=A0ABU0ZK48_9ACTN|nr:phosphopantetheine-binding protein [Phytohabitans sp. ZYX-F-186]MDQ7907414.1 phosphopantetheine-binding protein [Phytohabitans sp. ZYX-F-186]